MEIKTVNEESQSEFEAMVSDYLKEGYIVSSTSCNSIHISQYGEYKTVWNAILIK